MLWELHIQNFAVIEDMRLEFRPGLTVLSGDEGAGKSLLVDALCLLTGGRASTDLIRHTRSAALVEGIFHVEPDTNNLAEVLEEAGLCSEPDGSLIISREVQEQGRSVARINGRAVPVSLLREVGHRIMDIHSQMEHLALLDALRQTDLLDGYAKLLPLRQELAGKVSELRERSRQLSLVSEDGSQRQRELFEYQVAEIEQANVQQGEDEDLEQEWRILQRAQELKELCFSAYAMLYEDDRSATGLAHQAIKAMERAMSIDPALSSQVEGIGAAVAAVEEIVRDLKGYADSVEDSPSRLQEVESRLESLRKLKHKYGPTLEDVLRYVAETRQKLQTLESAEEQRRALEERYQELLIETGEMAERLSRCRQEAAYSLARMVNIELAELGMPWARFDISLKKEEGEDGLPAYNGRYLFSQYGIDRVQFMAITNPGEELRPLSQIASGGETCRFMLALKTSLRHADPVPTLVFDEIDSGVGGRNAHAVGRKLSALAEDRQVICITHLPQIACFGDNHYRVVKDVGSEQAFTSVEHLQGNVRVRELAAMLGGTRKPMLQSALDLLKGAKESHQPELAGLMK